MNPTTLVLTIVGVLTFGYVLIVPAIGAIVLAYVIDQYRKPEPAIAGR